MEGQNLGGEGPIQPIGDGATPVGAPVDVVVVAAAGAGGGGTVELGSGGGGGQAGRKKRGRPPKAQAKPPPAKKIKEEEEEEDVCFICFDGGSLVLCDRRGCPKAYHPACIKRDEAFFESAAKWNCGWHICSICQKSAHHMCYTCTYSLCKGCIRKADYVCVRDKGFCTICMKTIMLIENNGEGEDGKVQVDFDDKTSWEYLFKVYWLYLKGKLSLTLEELTQAKNPWKLATIIPPVLPSTGVHTRSIDLKNMTPSTTPSENLEENDSKRRKIDEEQINILHKETVNTEKTGNENNGSTVTVGCDEWATKELLDFISHMKNGDTSLLSQFDVQALLMEYIKKNNLRDPKRKTQIICDSRLKNLLGKSRVGHNEMLKILEYHLVGKDKKRRNRNKGEDRSNKLDEYAAIDVHNMNLIYLKRNLMENLLEDSESFDGKVVGSIVRIRVSGSDQKNEMYRLVQVVGTSKVDEPYKIGNKLVDVMLEVLNLDKKEIISIDTISDQEFSEEECRRLQQSIRCGLVKPFTVGEIQEKAVALQSVRLNDWMETEILRLNHLCDTASEKGHKKGYRENMEKLQLLKTPEERERRLQEIPEVHSDPKMNPDYESDDTEEYFNKEHGEHMESKYSAITIKNSRHPKKRPEISNDADVSSCKMEQPSNPSVENGSTKDNLGLSLGKSVFDFDCDDSTITKWNNQTTLSVSLSNNAPQTAASSLSLSNNAPQTAASSLSIQNTTSNEGETNILWHYRDPNGKAQGPFSLVQLQRWSTTGYFPPDMRIWTTREDKSLLLNDVLKEQFPSSTIVATPPAPNTEKLNDNHGSSSQSFGQNWSVNNNIVDFKPPSVGSFTISNVSTHVSNVDLPKSSQEDAKKVQSLPNSELLIQDSRNPPSFSSASSLEPANGWDGCSLKPLEVVGDHAATPTSNIENNNDNIISVSQPACNNNENNNINELPSWNGVGEMIEFSTLAEESVSDLLAEVDAMESQYGLPSPTSRRNSFVDDLFNGSFDEFSPTPDQGTRSDGFSSSGDIQLANTDEHLVGSFDLMKNSDNNMGFKWPRMIDINRSAKAEVEEGEIETKTSFIHIQPLVPPPPSLPPPPPPPLTLGLDPCGKMNDSRAPDRYNNNSNSNSNSNSSGRTSYGGARPPLKGQRVCKFYESGRCKKGATCKYLHP